MTPDQAYFGNESTPPIRLAAYLHYVFDLWAERWRRQEARRIASRGNG
jgi:hypothetical protein